VCGVVCFVSFFMFSLTINFSDSAPFCVAQLENDKVLTPAAQI